MDLQTGKYPPLYIKNGAFVYPEHSTVEGEETKRLLKFGMQLILNKSKKHLLSLIFPAETGDTLEILCHGSANKPNYISNLGEELNLSQTSLTCKSSGDWGWDHPQFVLDVPSLTCSVSMEPAILRTPNSGCSPVGADGRTDNLEELVTVQIGWNVNGAFLEQINLCVDELMYATLSTQHDVIGKSIDFRDITSGRPSFRRDITRMTNLFSRFPTQSAIEE